MIGMLDAITHGGFRTILIQAGSEEMVAFNHLGVLDRRDGPFAQQTTNDNFTTGRSAFGFLLNNHKQSIMMCFTEQ